MRTGHTRVMPAMLAATITGMLALPTAAAAEETQLCTNDSESSCTAATSVHVVSVGKGKLLSEINVECNVLFSSLSVSAAGAPQTLTGHFTYSNCGTFCLVREVSASSTIQVLRESHETASVTGNGEVEVNCFFLECTYDGENLVGQAKGPLLSAQTPDNGEVTISGQETHPVEGPCQEPGFLDLTMTPLSAAYIGEKSKSPKEEPKPDKTALCDTDEATSTCFEEHKPSSVDFKDSAVEFLTNLLNSKCEGLISGSVGVAGKPQEVKVESKYSSCTNGCAFTEISAGSSILFLLEGELSKELATATTEGLEIFVKCGTTIKCAFGPMKTGRRRPWRVSDERQRPHHLQQRLAGRGRRRDLPVGSEPGRLIRGLQRYLHPRRLRQTENRALLERRRLLGITISHPKRYSIPHIDPDAVKLPHAWI
jgi:hypothetical protein